MTRPVRCVLLNPHAQGGRAQRSLETIRAALPADVVLHAPSDLSASLALLYRLPEGSRVVAVGGDGSLHRWLPALLARDHELGVVPLGSGNDVARALGIYRSDALSVLTHALNGAPSFMDLGHVSWHDAQGMPRETHFLSSLSTGFDAAVVRHALDHPSRLQGMARYAWATLGALRQLSNWSMDVTADGKSLHNGPALLASSLNTPSFGSGIPAAPHARTQDGVLNLLLAGPFDRLGVLAMLPRLLMGRHLGHARVQTLAFESLTVLAPNAVPLAADGEWLGMARALQVVVKPAALRVVPRA